jgi:UDP-GlcNAc:undecaprenyl-phosphate GlcNAc-1-phosphate transferase
MWLIGLVTFFTALSFSLTGTWLMRRVAPRLGLMDRPGIRKVHVEPKPMGGGIAIWGSFVFTVGAAYLAAWAIRRGWVEVGAWLPHIVTLHLDGMFSRARLVALLLGLATIVMVMGLVDDRRGLSYMLRLAIEAALVAILIWQGVRMTLLPPLSHVVISGALTVAWIVGLTNSFNFLDNMDGLSAGVAWISSLLLCVLMALVGNYFVAGFLLALLGALSGFLWFNWSPASIFMGDAGSNFVGFMLGVITVVATFTRQNLPEIAIAAPLCVLAVPIYDSVTVILIRLREGRSPFQADKSHFSHRLVALGMTHKQAVLTIYLVTLATGLGALHLYPLSEMMPGLSAVVVLLQVACLLGVVAVLESAGLRKRNNGH